MASSIAEMRWTVLMAVLVALLTAPAGQIWWDGVLSYYDDARPVVQAKGVLLRLEPDAAVVHLSGKKLRQCTYLRIQAYAVDAAGNLHDAYARRIDMPERGDSKPVGSFNIGSWRVWLAEDPQRISQFARVDLFAQHDCDSRMVSTKIAEVHLK